MRSRITAVIFSAMLVFSACGPLNARDDFAEQTASASEEAIITEAPAFSEAPGPSFLPDYSGTMLIEPDPEREFYTSLVNQDLDIYPETDFGSLSFFIITKEYHTTDEISVTFPMRTKHTVTVSDATRAYRQLSGENFMQGYSYYHYACTRGMDWKSIYELKLETERRLRELEQEEISDPLEKLMRSNEFNSAYRDALYAYRDDYNALTEDELPEFNVFGVNVLLVGPELIDETVTEAEIAIGGRTYPISFGEWRIHRELPAELTARTSGITQRMLAVTAILDSPYNGGYVRLDGGLSFTANKDITITGFRTYGADIELLGAHVRSADAVMDWYWDMKMPLDVAAGESFSADILLHDGRFSEYEVCSSLFILMDYELDGRPYSMLLPCLLQRFNNLAETYLMAFEGVDAGPYRYYSYIPSFETWLFEMPESFKR